MPCKLCNPSIAGVIPPGEEVICQNCDTGWVSDGKGNFTVNPDRKGRDLLQEPLPKSSGGTLNINGVMYYIP